MFIFSMCFVFTALPTAASNTATSSHNRTIQSFIDDITSLQNRVFSIAGSALEASQPDTQNLNYLINLVNLDIESLNKSILEYLSTLPSISSQTSDTLLIQNALNLVKNSLYQIDLLVNAPSKVDQLLILQEFFRLRVNAAETLTGIQNIISSK